MATTTPVERARELLRREADYPIHSPLLVDVCRALIAAEERVQELERALGDSIAALDDWRNTYAFDLVSADDCVESFRRIDEKGGTLAYIARLQESARAALAKGKE